MEIRPHFLKSLCTKGDIKLEFVRTEDQLAAIFTKHLMRINLSILEDN